MQVWIERIRRQLMRDKRKLAVMGGLAVVACGMWARVLLSGGPATAEASTKVVSVKVAKPSDEDVFSDSVATVSVRGAKKLKRNLFSFDTKGYSGVKGSNFGSVQAKSGSSHADEEQRLAAVRHAAAGLSLQSVITGSQPRVVIDGTMISIGQKIHGFTLTQVLDRQAVLEMDGIVVHLSM